MDPVRLVQQVFAARVDGTDPDRFLGPDFLVTGDPLGLGDGRPRRSLREVMELVDEAPGRTVTFGEVTFHELPDDRVLVAGHGTIVNERGQGYAVALYYVATVRDDLLASLTVHASRSEALRAARVQAEQVGPAR